MSFPSMDVLLLCLVVAFVSGFVGAMLRDIRAAYKARRVRHTRSAATRFALLHPATSIHAPYFEKDFSIGEWVLFRTRGKAMLHLEREYDGADPLRPIPRIVEVRLSIEEEKKS